MLQFLLLLLAVAAQRRDPAPAPSACCERDRIRKARRRVDRRMFLMLAEDPRLPDSRQKSTAALRRQRRPANSRSAITERFDPRPRSLTLAGARLGAPPSQLAPHAR